MGGGEKRKIEIKNKNGHKTSFFSHTPDHNNNIIILHNGGRVRSEQAQHTDKHAHTCTPEYVPIRTYMYPKRKGAVTTVGGGGGGDDDKL